MERRDVVLEALMWTLAQSLLLARKLGGWFRSGDRGSALVETALVAPILVTLLCGVVEYGIIYVDDISLQNSARSAVRYAISNPTKWSTAEPAPANSIQGQAELEAKSLSGFVNTTQAIALTYLNPSPSFALCATYSGAAVSSACTQPGNMIQVTVGYTYTFFTPLFQAAYPDGLRVSATAIMQEMQ